MTNLIIIWIKLDIDMDFWIRFPSDIFLLFHQTMVMCMRMVSPSESRDVSTSHAAAATVRQLVALVFERALAEADGKILNTVKCSLIIILKRR